MYRLRRYRRAFIRYGASNKYGVGKTILESISLARWRCMTADAFYGRVSITKKQVGIHVTTVINVILFSMKLTK